MANPKLNRIKIYPEDPSKDAIANNLVLELNGQKLEGVVHLSYEIKTGNLPIVKISLIGDAVIESDGDISTDIIEF